MPVNLKRRHSRAGTRSARAHESGQVLVLVVLGAFALFGAAALGIDVSRMFEERRAAQAAADHAATAAALSDCTSGDMTAAIAAGRAAAARNQYDDTSASVTVTISRVGAVADHAIMAAISSTIPSTFARLVGFDTFTISVDAVAGASGCTGVSGYGPGAIYAGGDNCTSGNYAVDVSGSSDNVYGGVHSNSDARVGGASNRFHELTSPDVDDPFTYAGVLAGGSLGNGNVYQTPTYPQDLYPSSPPGAYPAGAWPTDWAPTDVTGGGGDPPDADSLLRAYYDLAVATGHFSTNKIDAVPTDGVYYTTHPDGFDVSTSANRRVVLVAPNGPIKLSGSGVTWNAITDEEIDDLPGMDTEPNLSLNLPRAGILLLSNMQRSPADKKCSEFTIAISGGNSDWNGILWAPGGLIEMSGSSNVATSGSLVGWAVRLNGSNLSIRYNSGLFTTPADPDVTISR